MTREIKNALVEETRPPIYTAMKYWGKKPHNIWREYISAYTPDNGVVLDPFCGSGMSAFEAVKAGRRAVAFDLNPLSRFVIEALSEPFHLGNFRRATESIVREVLQEPIYQKFFYTRSRRSDAMAEAHCFKWKDGMIYEVGVTLTENEPAPVRGRSPYYSAPPDEDDLRRAAEMGDIKFDFWRPSGPFHSSPSFSSKFIQAIGGDDFGNLWTRRNLFVLAAIFDRILAVEDKAIQRHLLFGFVQSAHLCTKMCVPRRAAAGRPFSTSWGRSAYLCTRRQMEMNPLHVFEKNCLGPKQSVKSCLSVASAYLGRAPSVVSVRHGNKQKNKTSGFDIKCGVVDINTAPDYLADKSVDFVISDPPYGGLVQYLDLSELWLRWLARWDSEYAPNFDAEITVKAGVFSQEIYQRRFAAAMREIHRVMKDDATAVFTFHNREISVWNAFLRAIQEGGFVIVRVVHQYNRRSGEAAVSHPYGTSASDFYIQCKKGSPRPLSPSPEEFESYVVDAAVRVIAERNEPTPYEFVESGVLVAVSQAGFDLGEFSNRNIPDILRDQIGPVFKVEENSESRAGNLWWLATPERHILYPDLPLRRRVEAVIVSLFRRKASVTIDDVLGEIFPRFVNGLTPDIRSLGPILKKYAAKSGGRWIARNLEIQQAISAHTESLMVLSAIGRRMGYSVFIGKREQWESTGRGQLSDHADLSDLPELEGVCGERRERVLMIDMLWLERVNEHFRIAWAIEVENTTDFISAIQRASNLPMETPKMMVIPDERERELCRAGDPVFLDNFRRYNWCYLTYARMNRLRTSRQSNEHDILSASQKI